MKKEEKVEGEVEGECGGRAEGGGNWTQFSQFVYSMCSDQPLRPQKGASPIEVKVEFPKSKFKFTVGIAHKAQNPTFYSTHRLGILNQ